MALNLEQKKAVVAEVADAAGKALAAHRHHQGGRRRRGDAAQIHLVLAQVGGRSGQPSAWLTYFAAWLLWASVRSAVFLGG